MKKLISLGILSLSLIACGEQFQSYYVGNAQLTGANTCINTDNASGEVSLRVRARFSGSDADFTIMSATEIDTASGPTTAARNVFNDWFVRDIRGIAANITQDTFIQEKDPVVRLDTSRLLSSGLDQNMIDQIAAQERLTISGDASSSRDQINNFSVRRFTWNFSTESSCEIGFIAPKLIRQ